MSLGAIPEEVLRFLAEKIDTVPHLEALLLLAEDPARGWTEEEVAARIYTSRETAVAVLKDLQLHRLVRLLEGTPPRFVYDPAWDTENLLPKIVTVYRRQLIQVATYIHSKASSSVREFARAFDFKKER